MRPTIAKGEVMQRRSIITAHLKVAILVGAATGLRATVGLTALINRRATGLPTWLARQPAAVVAPLAFTGELVADKLPSTPSRLEPMGLAARVALGALAGAVIARSTDQPRLLTAVVASAAAVASARIGHDVRAAASDRISPCAVAAAEDGLALALAGAASASLP
jgi:uncharacterized membrane protein